MSECTYGSWFKKFKTTVFLVFPSEDLNHRGGCDKWDSYGVRARS